MSSLAPATPATPARSQGFTLLEIMIALSLTAMLLTMLTAGMYGVVRDWDNNAEGLERSLDETVALLQLERALQGAFPHSYRDTDTLARHVFFTGEPEALSWVSTVSPQRNAGLTAWRLYDEPGTGVYLQLAPALSDNPQQRLQDAEPRLLLADYTVEFNYLFEDLEFARRWRDTWAGDELTALPMAVHILLRPDADSARSEEINVIAPIRTVEHRSLAPTTGLLQ
ncbi:prepilin-type N-terminal cleavage/methylation domain-containing protein [Pseudohongiella sp.]|uniref:Type II secretion system protein J n=1 Tax=marine sediment metagenome TaxID=412755 RepID=A0A0F9YA16_9ZZZZ|nr:prepilin-type N-terminal cleavage/methylation domain-containing protein [Pseudohongiella sp.]HDZ08714.1 prepilin-type N-terminal cleavage/methylation domain-containing protein [Pseudohongiella sp.]HEA62330.1 prepilin-type N-terminal cleavage/methylation domain-containing protein [Pseudohongiella sp.]